MNPENKLHVAKSKETSNTYGIVKGKFYIVKHSTKFWLAIVNDYALSIDIDKSKFEPDIYVSINDYIKNINNL